MPQPRPAPKPAQNNALSIDAEALDNPGDMPHTAY